MSRRLTQAAPEVLANGTRDDGTCSWQIVVGGECVALVSLTFTAANEPARIQVQPPVDLRINPSGLGWLVDPAIWADYTCAGCGEPGYGTPVTIQGVGEPVQAHNTRCAVDALERLEAAKQAAQGQ